MKDVRIASYKTKKGDMCHITFYDGVEGLIDANYIKLSDKNDRLYFVPTDEHNGVKLTNKAQIQKYSYVSVLNRWVGEYPLNHDSEKGLYYIALEDKVETVIDSGSRTNIPHQSSYNRPSVPTKVYNASASAPPKTTIKDIVFDYVTRGEFEKAQVATEIAKRLAL